MSSSRIQYFTDLLEDCDRAIASAGLEDSPNQGLLILALVLSDSVNGLRRAVLEGNEIRGRE